MERAHSELIRMWANDISLSVYVKRSNPEWEGACLPTWDSNKYILVAPHNIEAFEKHNSIVYNETTSNFIKINCVTLANLS